ncbi:Aste57867_19209 [Aphanomyces stellatus]|uniref:Aste57867_19209 protein n=1 Tax=Aphanomyces stellatus TaxID=120398 RepID=A0A485LCB3_9STRA|nr:hypothetical protein As57867_019145 [Aphanomyces stellatus]VFT95930.1 Aste57867_19209 [Aphanomyces stellatus]
MRDDDKKPSLWHSIAVAIANKLLKTAHVTIVVRRRVDTGWIAETTIDVDKTKSCEATDWMPGLTLLTAHLNDTYHPFKTLVHGMECPTVIVPKAESNTASRCGQAASRGRSGFGGSDDLAQHGQ